jgi:hypothetical protein
MIIGKNLKKLLENNNHRLAKEMLKLETLEATFDNDVDYVEIAVDNPSKIGFLTKARFDRINVTTPYLLEVGAKISLTKECFCSESTYWSGRSSVVENEFIVSEIEFREDGKLKFLYVKDPSWIIHEDQIDGYSIETNMIDLCDPWDKELRQKFAYMTTPSRFLKKFDIECVDKELEEFNKLFMKDDICLRIEGLHFELVSGSKIKDGYLEDNYYNENGSLGSSCMRYSSTQSYIQTYADYPEKIQLLTLITNDNKIRGRAVVWNCLHNEGEITFMDRIYTDNSNFEAYFISYAQKNKWWYKEEQSRSNWENFMSPDNAYLDPVKTKGMKILLPYAYDKEFPYTDTFVSGDVNVNNVGDVVLYNDTRGSYDFQDTDGGPLCNRKDMVWSDWHDEDIPEEDSVYSARLGTYIREDDSVEMDNGEYMPDGHDDVVEIRGSYYYMEDCVYSECHGEYYLSDDVTFVEDEDDYFELSEVVYSDRLGKDLLKENAVYSEYYADWLLMEDCEEINNDWILKEDVEEYKVEMGLVEEEVE